MVLDTTSPRTGHTTTSQAPIGTTISPRFTAMLPPRYHVLNASIPTPTQITFGTPGISTPSGHHLVPMNYLPPHQQPNLPISLHYMQTAYGPTGLLMRLPPQSHQYPHVNRQFPFLATLDLPDLSRILNDMIRHSPQWPTILAKLPFDIPKFHGKPGKHPNNHVMTFHLWCTSNSLMDDSICLHLF
jgi:hypothetical protein